MSEIGTELGRLTMEVRDALRDGLREGCQEIAEAVREANADVSQEIELEEKLERANSILVAYDNIMGADDEANWNRARLDYLIDNNR